MIRLFASDLDGTLLGALHDVSLPVRAAIREVTDAGAHFAVATGRTFRSSGDFGFEGLPCEVVCANGAIVLNRESEVVRFATMDPAVIEEMLAAFPAAPFMCIGREHSYVRGTREAYEAGYEVRGPVARVVDGVRMRAMRRGQARYPHERVFDCSAEEILSRDICKVNCRVRDAGMARELSAFISERADRIVDAPFSPVMFEITAAGVNKGEAVEWLAGYLGISRDEVAVYGDGGNDIAMLERFAPYGHAFAPYGASDDAKRAAGLVLGSNLAYAVPRHMVHTVRGRKPAAVPKGT